MSNDQDDLRPTDAPLDALLHERLGRESAPDMTRLVAARHDRGDGAHIAAMLDRHDDSTSNDVVTRGNHRPLLTAAMILLGIGAVAGTVWIVQDQSADTTANNIGTAQAQQPQQSGGENPIVRDAPAAQDPVLQDPRAKRNPFAKLQDPKQQSPQGKLSISVKVVDQHGGPIQDFEVEVLYVAGQTPLQVGITTAIPSQKRHPRDFEGDYTVIKGLRPGSYVVSVEDGMHAPTMSDPFDVPEHGKTPQVVVRMNNGGTVRGTVVDSKGRPIAGATVQASPSIKPTPNPLESFLKNLKPRVPKPRTATSDRDGSFEFTRLVPGKYVVRALHEDFSTSQTDTVKVTEKARRAVKVTLKPGAVIFGRVTKDGKPMANYQVRVTTLLRDDKFGGNFVTRTDDEGNFKLPERLAPGRYRIESMSDANSENPFGKLRELKESQHDFDIDQDQRKLERNIDFK